MKLVPQGPEHLQQMFEFEQNTNQILQAAFAEARDLQSFTERWHRNAANSENLFFVIVEDGQICGSVGKWMMNADAELAYWVGEAFEGRGLASRAMSEFLKLFTERPLFAHVVNDNFGSIKVLEKNGFRLVDSFESFAPARGADVTELEYRLG
jgi:ribosomal-protein-alanine N-acetyltransferase